MYGEMALFSGTANRPLAEEVSQVLNIPLSDAQVFKFPNQNIFCRLGESVRGKDVFIIQPTCASIDDKGNRTSVNDNLMELLIMIDTVKRDSAGRVTAVVPYYGYGRTDKKDQPRVPITARLVADMITAAGANRFLTVDLHAGQIQGFFSIPVDELKSRLLFSNYYREKKIENAVAVAADIGGTRRVRDFAELMNLPIAIIEKRRTQLPDGSRAQVLNVIGDVNGKNAIIFDDEIDTAGTVVRAVNFLKDNGCKDVYVCATHAVLSPPAVESLRVAPIKEVTVTNTVPILPEKGFETLHLLSIAPLIGEVIRRIHLGISVGELFGEGEGVTRRS